ncbi:MAG: hypothetical protein IJ730_02095 [Alphaproteobacteria bacterium]|nr:hypothetical protein [Alphaproteobacteria bacterium]
MLSSLVVIFDRSFFCTVRSIAEKILATQYNVHFNGGIILKILRLPFDDINKCIELLEGNKHLRIDAANTRS